MIKISKKDIKYFKEIKKEIEADEMDIELKSELLESIDSVIDEAELLKYETDGGLLNA